MSVEFIDTNVLVYAFDATAGKKHDVARELVRTLTEARQAAISTQVLQEFFVVATAKIKRPLSNERAREIVSELRVWEIVTIHMDDILTAADLCKTHRIAFWDALIVAAAKVAGAETIWSEDLNDKQRFEAVQIRNPFK